MPVIFRGIVAAISKLGGLGSLLFAWVLGLFSGGALNRLIIVVAILAGLYFWQESK